MAEYIEKNVAIARLTALEIGNPCATMTDAKQQIAVTRPADVTPVTRCKDCANSYEDAFGRVCTYSIYVDCTVPDDFYCASGKPKEGAE